MHWKETDMQCYWSERRELYHSSLHSRGKVHLFVCLYVRLCGRLFRDSGHKTWPIFM